MILVAGIGNIFNGDDGFGVEVARQLACRPQRPGVKVVDFGIRGIDLTYALLDGCSAAILIDAAPLGRAPGTVSIVEPQSPSDASLEPGPAMLSAHDLDPAKVLQLVGALGGNCRRVMLVACEPLDCGGEEGAMGLTPAVAAAVGPAIQAVEALIAELQNPGAQAA